MTEERRQEQTTTDKKLRFLWEKFRRILMWCGRTRSRINNYMRKSYTPALCGLLVTAASLVVGGIILFVPPYLGVANDATITTVMDNNGLRFLNEDVESNYNNYFVRVYENTYMGAWDRSVHSAVIRAAKKLDFWVTGDNLFDVRFLAAIYLFLFLPAEYLVVKSALERLKYFSETVVINALGLIIFADISYLAYFNSLYPEPFMYIGMLYITGAVMSLQKESKFHWLYLCTIFLWGILLSHTRVHCVVVGLGLALFCVLILRIYREIRYRILFICISGGYY